MSEIASKVTDIIVEKLGVEKSEVTLKLVLPTIWELIRWTLLN